MAENNAQLSRSGDKRLRHNEPTYEKLRDQLIVKHYVASRDECFDNKQHQDSAYFGLPEEIKLIIFNLLPYSDLITMARTCKSMAEFVNRNYVPSLILPLSPQNLEKLDGRDVLCLKSDFNIMALERERKGEYLENLDKIKLSNLQKLVFVLYEHSEESIRPCRHILPPLYKDILNHYLSFAKQLTYLHISIDRSEETFDIIDLIVDGLPCLSKIVLQATNTPNNVTHPIEGDVSEETRARAAELQVPGLYPELTLNKLLEKLLVKRSLRSLEILDLSLTQSWDSDRILGDVYPLRIKAKRLTHLKIVQDAFCDIGSIKCPKLVEFKYVDLGEDNIEQWNCIVHNYELNERFWKLSSGCPKLERLNDIDFESLENTFQLCHFSGWDYDRLNGQYKRVFPSGCPKLEKLNDMLKSACNCKLVDENDGNENENCN